MNFKCAIACVHKLGLPACEVHTGRKEKTRHTIASVLITLYLVPGRHLLLQNMRSRNSRLERLLGFAVLPDKLRDSLRRSRLPLLVTSLDQHRQPL